MVKLRSLLHMLFRRPMQALCAAHAAALLTCEAHCSMASDDPSVAHSALQSLATVIGQGPAAVGLDPTLQRLFGQLWDIVSQQVRLPGMMELLQSCFAAGNCMPGPTIPCCVSEQGGHAQAVVWLNVLDAAQHSVRLAAFLAACGYYDTLMALSVQAVSSLLSKLGLHGAPAEIGSAAWGTFVLVTSAWERAIICRCLAARPSAGGFAPCVGGRNQSARARQGSGRQHRQRQQHRRRGSRGRSTAAAATPRLSFTRGSHAAAGGLSSPSEA